MHHADAVVRGPVRDGTRLSSARSASARNGSTCSWSTMDIRLNTSRRSVAAASDVASDVAASSSAARAAHRRAANVGRDDPGRHPRVAAPTAAMKCVVGVAAGARGDVASDMAVDVAPSYGIASNAVVRYVGKCASAARGERLNADANATWEDRVTVARGCLRHRVMHAATAIGNSPPVTPSR